MRFRPPALTLWALALVGCQKASDSGAAPQPVENQRPKRASVSADGAKNEPPVRRPASLGSERKPLKAQSEKTKNGTKRRYVVAALGDSITDGRSGGGGYLQVLREKCPESVFFDFGKGGDMTNQMRRRFETVIRPQISSREINTLLVYGGVNDLYSDLTAGRTNERVEADLSRIYSAAKSDHLEVIAVTVSPWGGFTRYWNRRRGDNTRLLNSWILGQVEKQRIDHAVDSFPLLSCGDENILCRDYETPSHDGLHPGPVGHELLGEKLAEEAFADCL